MTLEWRQHEHDPTCYVSSCRRYSVSTHDGVWDAWRVNVEGSLFAQIGRALPDRSEAERMCNEDSWQARTT